MNKVVLIGRLTRDPELRYTQSGKAFATFTLAVDRKFKKDQQAQADFIPCMAWDKLAEIVGNPFLVMRWTRNLVQLLEDAKNSFCSVHITYFSLSTSLIRLQYLFPFQWQTIR